MATSTLPQSHPRASMCWRSYRWYKDLYKVQRSLLSAIVYTAQVKNSRHPFLPGVPLPALAFVVFGNHPPAANLNSSQSKTFKYPKGVNGFCLINRVRQDAEASVHAIEPLLEWQSIRKRCSWRLMCLSLFLSFCLLLFVQRCVLRASPCPDEGKRPERPLLGQALKTKTGLSTYMYIVLTYVNMCQQC